MLKIRMQLYAVQPKLRYAVGLGVYIFKIGMQRTQRNKVRVLLLRSCKPIVYICYLLCRRGGRADYKPGYSPFVGGGYKVVKRSVSVHGKMVIILKEIARLFCNCIGKGVGMEVNYVHIVCVCVLYKENSDRPRSARKGCVRIIEPIAYVL